jgi:hypothetical protein
MKVSLEQLIEMLHRDCGVPLNDEGTWGALFKESQRWFLKERHPDDG